MFRSNVGYGRTKLKPLAPITPGAVDPSTTALAPALSLPTSDTSHLPLHHSYFDARPVLDPPSKKITDPRTQRPWSDVASVSGEPAHSRFANWFGRGHRRGLAGRSVESLALPFSNGVPAAAPVPARPMQRAKSLHHIGRTSGVPSVDASKPFWRRTSIAEPLTSPAGVTRPLSSPGTDLATTPREAEDATPTALSPFSSRGSLHQVDTAGTTPPPSTHPAGTLWNPAFDASPPSTERRAEPSRRFSLFDLPTGHTHAHATPSFFPRSLTRSSAARTTSGRFRSFFHFLPLPFLSAASRQVSEELPPRLGRPERTGPRRGEVQVLQYDAVTDLVRMGAVSDHRPVFAVVAIGVEEDVEA